VALAVGPNVHIRLDPILFDGVPAATAASSHRTHAGVTRHCYSPTPPRRLSLTRNHTLRALPVTPASEGFLGIIPTVRRNDDDEPLRARCNRHPRGRPSAAAPTVMSRALGAVRDPVAALACAAQGNTWSVRHGEWIVGVIGAVLIIVGLVTLVRLAHPSLGEHGAHGAIRWRRRFAVAEIVVGMVMLVGAVLSRGGISHMRRARLEPAQWPNASRPSHSAPFHLLTTLPAPHRRSAVTAPAQDRADTWPHSPRSSGSRYSCRVPPSPACSATTRARALSAKSVELSNSVRAAW